MNLLLDQKYRELKTRRDLELAYLRARIPIVFRKIRLARQTIDEIALIRKSYRQGFPKSFSKSAQSILAIEAVRLKDTLRFDEAEFTKLTAILNEDVVMTEFLLDAQPYFSSSVDTASMRDEFTARYLASNRPKLRITKKNPAPRRKGVRFEITGPFCFSCHGFTTFLASTDSTEDTCSVCNTAVNDRLVVCNAENDFLERTTTKILPYKRLIYFREFLRQLQAKTRVKIPFIVTNTVLTDLLLQGKSLSQVTIGDVRASLRKNGFNSFNEHLPAILLSLQPSYRPLDLPSHVEARLCIKFVRFEAAFQKALKAKLFVGRTSMLSYHFLCFKFCAEENFRAFQRIWKLAKSLKLRDKHELIYQKINALI